MSRLSECPAVDCLAAKPTQEPQNPEALRSAGAMGNWLEDAQRCSYCDMVWTWEDNGRKVVRGYIEHDGTWANLPKV